MKNSFKEAIRTQVLKAPTDRSFSLSRWKSTWNDLENDQEKHIYEAGITFSKLLETTRSRLSELYQENFPGISLNRVLELYCSISNRDIIVASKTIKEKLSGGSNVHSLLMSNNPAANPLSSEEIAVGAIDGVQPAIRTCILNIRKKKHFPTGKDKTTPIEFVRQEALLSNLYASYEQYFQALIWGDFSYEKIGKKIKIQQTPSQDELALEVSNLRKSRSHIRNLLYASDPSATKLLHGRHEYVKVHFNGFNFEKFFIEPIQKAPARIQAENVGLILSTSDAIESFPKELIEKNIQAGEFSLKEALEVLRNLSLIAKQFSSKMMCCDENVFSSHQMLNYLAQTNRKDLIVALSRVTGFSSSKTRQILDFICFSGDSKQDLWSHPIIETRKGKLSFLVTAAASPIMQRVLEHWLTECFNNNEIKEKGKVYEKKICTELNSNIKKNQLITDFCPATSASITINGKNEQIDLIFRIGSVVVIGEIKAIVTSDNPISHFWAKDRLEYGAHQAKRKSTFVKENIEKAFKELKWEFEKEKDYKIVPIVVNNNKTFSGFPIHNIPIVDNLILASYFGQQTFPLVSYYDPNTQEMITTAKYRLYNNFKDLQENLEKFLLLPPAIEGESGNFINKSTYLPSTNDEVEVIEFSRLVYNELSDTNMKLKRSTSFPVEKTSQHDELVDAKNILF